MKTTVSKVQRIRVEPRDVLEIFGLKKGEVILDVKVTKGGTELEVLATAKD